MNGPLDLLALVLLLAGAVVSYVAYLHSSVGGALLIGVAVTTLLCMLLGPGDGGPPQP